MVVNKKKDRWLTDVKYDVVQFNLVNPTYFPVNFDLFKTSRLSNVRTTPEVFNPVGNQNQQTVSGTSPVINGMGYLPSVNYIFMACIGGKRIVWDVTNQTQISEYKVGANSMQGNIIERPADGKLWGVNSGASSLIQSDWQANTEVLFPVTTTTQNAGVYYDPYTDTIYFGYVGVFKLGSFDLSTNTLTDIITPLTINSTLAMDVDNRRLYVGGTAPSGSTITVIDLDSKTVVGSYNFNTSGIGSISNLAVDESNGRLFGAAFGGGLNRVGYFDLTAVTFTTIISGSVITYGSFLNLVITQNTLFAYDTRSLVDTISTINTLSNTVIDNKVPVGGTISTNTTAHMVVAPSQYVYASKGTGGTVAGQLTEFPITQSFYITGSVDYNFFVESIFNDPKRVFAIEFDMTFDAMRNPWVIVNKDANGQECSVPYIPNNYNSKNQFDPRFALVDFENGYIMDINSYSQYTIPENTTVILLIWYKEQKRAEKLIRKIDFSDDSEAGIAKRTINQQDMTGVEILAESGRNIYNFWLPQTMMVDRMIDKGDYPYAWKNMEQMIPESMKINVNVEQKK